MFLISWGFHVDAYMTPFFPLGKASNQDDLFRRSNACNQIVEDTFGKLSEIRLGTTTPVLRGSYYVQVVDVAPSYVNLLVYTNDLATMRVALAKVYLVDR